MVDQVAALIHALGKHCQLTKIGIKSAYRIKSIHPEDTLLLGMRWKKVCVDTALPFHLRIAPKIFQRSSRWSHVDTPEVGSAIHTHYAYGTTSIRGVWPSLTNGAPNLQESGSSFAEEKVEGPTMCLTFLGIKWIPQGGSYDCQTSG